MIDRKFIGYERPARTIEVEKYPIRLFSQVIGETSPVHFDEDAARAAGYRSIVAPPTFLFSLDVMAPASAAAVDMGIDVSKILHGEQTFNYFRPIYAGDKLTFNARISDIYDKKNGALEFVVTDTDVIDQDGTKVADMRFVLVVRS
jgi:acyl dehydratase